MCGSCGGDVRKGCDVRRAKSACWLCGGGAVLLAEGRPALRRGRAVREPLHSHSPAAGNDKPPVAASSSGPHRARGAAKCSHPSDSEDTLARQRAKLCGRAVRGARERILEPAIWRAKRFIMTTASRGLQCMSRTPDSPKGYARATRARCASEASALFLTLEIFR